MRHLILAVLVSMGFLASANTKQQLERRAIMMSERVGEMLKNSAYMMSEGELSDVISLLGEVRNVIRGNPGGGSYRYIVTATVERTDITIEGDSLTELYSSCEAAFKKNGLREKEAFNDLSYSLNFGRQEEMTNTYSYWHGYGKACQLITTSLKEKNSIPVSDSRVGFIFMGTMEKESFYFQARSYAEINTQCVEFYNRKRVGAVNDITVSVDFGSIKTFTNTYSYWRTANEVCYQILQAR